MEMKKELVTRVVNGQVRYVFLCEFEDRYIAKDADFRFDYSGSRHWYTTDIAVAARLRNYARGPLRSQLEQVQARQRPVLSYENGVFVWRSEPQYFDYARRADFIPHATQRLWYTRDADSAVKLIHFADDNCKERLRKINEERNDARAASRALDADIEIPVPLGLEYFGYQRAAVKVAINQFAKERKDGKPPGVLFGDDMGVGKTVEIIATLNYVGDYGKVLILCPASIKVNWYRELTRWLVTPKRIMIADGQSSRWKLDLADIVIANYDILPRVLELRKRSGAGKKSYDTAVLGLGRFHYDWDFVICDEAHLLKNPATMRAQLAFALSEKGDRVIYATGSPIVNDTEELYPLLHALDPEMWPRELRIRRLSDLQDRLRGSGLLVRRLKSEVQKELPPKLRQIIEIDPGDDADVRRAFAAEAVAWEKINEKTERLRVAVELSKASDDPRDYERAVAALDEGVSITFEEMSRVRHQTALAKLPFVIQHIEDLLSSDPGYKLVVMAWHQDVIEQIAAAFGRRAAKVYGKTPSVIRVVGGQTTSARQQAVDRLQEDPHCQLLVCQIKAAGVGLNMTSAAHVVFGELHWVPGDMTQAEDRLHRIGQRSNVLVQHVVLRGSIDAKMVRAIVAKQAIIDQALDRQEHGGGQSRGAPSSPRPPASQPSLFPGEEVEYVAASESISPEAIKALAASLSLPQIHAIHRGLQLLANSGDSSGFNPVDAGVGLSLAGQAHLSAAQAALGRQIVQRYRGQLPDEMLETIFQEIT